MELALWGAAAPTFSTISGWVLVITLGWLAAHALWLAITRRGQRDSTATADATPRSARSDRRPWWAGILYLGFVLCVAVLAATSLIAIWQGRAMLGWSLLIHVATAGAFVFLLVAVAFYYLPIACGAGGQPNGESRCWLSWSSGWLLILASFATAISMLISMFSWLGTDDLLAAIVVHRYCGLLVVVAALLHGYSLICRHFAGV